MSRLEDKLGRLSVKSLKANIDEVRWWMSGRVNDTVTHMAQVKISNEVGNSVNAQVDDATGDAIGDELHEQIS